MPVYEVTLDEAPDTTLVVTSPVGIPETPEGDATLARMARQLRAAKGSEGFGLYENIAAEPTVPTASSMATTSTPKAPLTRTDALRQLHDDLTQQQTQQPQIGAPPTPAPPGGEAEGPQPITDDTIAKLVDQVVGPIDTGAKLSRPRTLVDAYDETVARFPGPIRAVFSSAPVRGALLVNDTIDTGAAKALTEIFGFPAFVINSLNRIDPANTERIRQGREPFPRIPLEGKDIRRLAGSILSPPEGVLEAPSGPLQVLQRVAEEVVGTTIAMPVIQKMSKVIRAMPAEEFAKFAMQQEGQALVSGTAAGLVREKTDKPFV